MTIQPADNMPEEPDDGPGDVQSFEDFWEEHTATRSREQVDVFGYLVDVPTDLPMSVEFDLKRLNDSDSIDDIKHLIGKIFGADLLTGWIEQGMTGQQFRVILMWGIANGQGKPTSFSEAVRLMRELEASEAAERGKAVPLNREARRTAARRKPTPATRGGRSRPTGT